VLPVSPESSRGRSAPYRRPGGDPFAQDLGSRGLWIHPPGNPPIRKPGFYPDRRGPYLGRSCSTERGHRVRPRGERRHLLSPDVDRRGSDCGRATTTPPRRTSLPPVAASDGVSDSRPTLGAPDLYPPRMSVVLQVATAAHLGAHTGQLQPLGRLPVSSSATFSSSNERVHLFAVPLDAGLFENQLSN